METELIKILVISSAVVHFVLVTVLGGVLITEYYKRKGKFRGGILGYGVFLIVILLFFVLDIYRNLVAPWVLFNWINLFLAFLAGVFFLTTSFKYLKNINKKLLFSIPPFAIGIIIIEVLRLLQIGLNLEIYTAIATLTATILGYPLIIGFLIDTSNKNKQNAQDI